MADDITLARTAASIVIELSNNVPSIVVLKAEHEESSDYLVRKFNSSGRFLIEYPSQIFRFGTLKGYVFPLIKDYILRQVNSNTSNVYQLTSTTFSNSDVPPMGTWNIGKAALAAKSRYYSIKAKSKKKKKSKEGRGGRAAFPEPAAPGGTCGPSVY